MWLGHRGLIFGRVRIESAVEIKTDEMWRELYPRHCWNRATRPYKRTFAMRLTDVERISRPQRYAHPSGAIGIVKYRRPTAADAAARIGAATSTSELQRKYKETLREPKASNAAARRKPAASPSKIKRKHRETPLEPAAAMEGTTQHDIEAAAVSRSEGTSAEQHLPRKRQRKVTEEHNEKVLSRRKAICRGLDEVACRFRRDGSGRAAQASTYSEKGRCIFCDADVMLNILVKAPSCIARALNNFKQKDAELHRAALGRRSRFLSGDTTISWEAALKRRASQQGLTTEEVQRGERARHRDGERATKKLPEIFGPDAVTMPWQSPRAAAFERWAEQESWLICPKCERLLPQRFVPGTSGTDRAATTRQTSRCPHCASNEVRGYPAPLPEDVLAPLERLPASVVEALRPFRISCGAGLKAPSGYWVHTAPIRFSWKDVPLEERIDRMEDAQLRAQTKAAAEWLLHREESAYKKFDELQRMYLAAAEKNEDLSPRMPIQFMESVGIECAAWPHLYWETRACETYVRSRDKRRLEKSDKEDTDEAQDVIATERRQSFKASYLAKLLSRVIGYGTEFELVQFIYDLWLYGGIGAAGNAVKTELRAALAGKSFSPEFWKTKHLALQDLQAQIGTPTLFVTVAPYEWTAPYHRWLLDEMEKTARSRTNLPAAESLHLAHILTEAVRGLLLGSYSDTCRECCLLPGSKKAIYFGRLEFQDGKRQTPQQQMRMQWYHGRGTVHVHVLVWLRDVDSKRKLPDVIAADLPETGTPMGSLVRDSQPDRSSSSWPCREEASSWDEENGLQLHHPPDAFAARCRAYIPELLQALKCHMDVQAGDGRGQVLRYTAGYIPKFSAAWPTNRHGEGGNVAERILTEYNPMEMEMMLQLSAHKLPQCFHTGDIVVPVPWVSEKIPRDITRYTQCEWRSAGMCLLEFMRRSDREGNIHASIKELYKKTAETQTLEEFANSCTTNGAVLVAAVKYNRRNPNFYKQWLLLHVPLRHVDDLWHKAVEAVPPELQGLALCLLHRPRFWRSMPAIRQEMELEACRDFVIECTLEAVKAQTEIVDAYLSGSRCANDSVRAETKSASVAREDLSPEQTAAFARICSGVNRAIEARTTAESEGEETWRQHVGAPRETPQPLAYLGAAGTGKSIAAKAAMKQALQEGGVVGVACPTGLLSATYRCNFMDAQVDTVHSFFGLHLQEEVTLTLLLDFDLIVVEEVGQISCEHFERILRLWDAADRRPVLVFVGDFMQLPAVDGTSARDSPRWNSVRATTFETPMRSLCPELTNKLQLLRKQCPTPSQLQWILRGHRASPADGLEPTSEDVSRILRERPNATLVTYTRRAAAHLNDLAVEAIFGNTETVPVPADPDCNLDNYQGKKTIAYEPAYISICVGMRISLCRNIDKPGDYVNGMTATIQAINQHGIEARTATGRDVTISKVTEEKTLADGEVVKSCFYPIRLGYAVTLHKVQGSTLEYMALWLDQENVAGAAYVALSRVRRDRDWQFFGRLNVAHFTPPRLKAGTPDESAFVFFMT